MDYKKENRLKELAGLYKTGDRILFYSFDQEDQILKKNYSVESVTKTAYYILNKDPQDYVNGKPRLPELNSFESLYESEQKHCGIFINPIRRMEIWKNLIKKY